MQFCYLLVLLSSAVAVSTARIKPLVVLPPSIAWNSDNTIIVTPNPNAYSSRVDIKAQILGSNGTAASHQSSHHFGKQNVNAGEPVELTTHVRSRADLYTITISVTGHADYSIVVKGAPNVESVFLQSDKTFYRPNETVSIRALPLTSGGSIFHGKLKYILQDPNGFEIYGIVEKAGSRFVDLKFILPTYLRFGKWKVVATSQKSSEALGEVAFRVEDYVLPKFHVNVQLEDHNKPLYTLQVTVLAKFPRGARVNGDLLLYCAIANERNNNTPPGAAQSSARLLLRNGTVANGEWKQEVDIRQCYRAALTSRVEIMAEVREAATFRAESGSAFYEVLKPGFEVIPARPAVVKGTKKIVLYVRPLSDDVNIKESEIFVNFCCVSNDINENGFQRNHSGYKLGGFLSLDFDVNPNCNVNIFKIYRKLSGSALSREELVAIPRLDDSSVLKLSWIESADPAKVLYYEGDVFEAHVTGGVRDLNYVVVCESKRVVASGKVADSNRISLPIQNGMKGVCMLYVYKMENPKTKLDMLLFMAESSSCPSNYRVSVSDTNIPVNQQITLTMTAADRALGLIRGIDSRLERMLETVASQRRHSVFSLAEFDGDNPREKRSTILSGFIDTPSLLNEISRICGTSAKSISQSYLPPNPPLGSSMISNLCLTRIASAILNRSHYRYSGDYGQLNDSEVKDNRKVVGAGVFGINRLTFTAVGPPQNIKEKPKVGSDMPMSDIPNNNDLEASSDFGADELFLRDFFPEVWFFKDYMFDRSGVVEERFVAPHSVAEWSFSSHFWAPARKNVCKLPSLTVYTSRHLYLDLDIPQHVYENETVEIRLSVNADKLEKSLSLALCIRGFSPVACGDLGTEGRTDVNDYTAMTIDPSTRKVEKSFFIRYLRDGTYDLQFELLDRSTLLSSRWNCNTGSAHVFDKIKHTLQVSKRVDVDEHFRQVVVHKSRRPATQFALAPTSRLLSLPDVIQFSDISFDNGTVQTTVGITSTERVYDIAVEFSEFTPSLPLKDLSSFVEMRNSPRRRRQAAALGSLSDVIGDLSLVAFQPKAKLSLQANDDDMQENQQNEIEIGNLLSELLTYSDCRSAHEACGFGEYGRPSSSQMRDIVLTTLATTLLCEQSTAEQYVCGPVKFLAEVIPQTSTSSSSFLEMLQFEQGKDSETFLRALLSWVGRECSAYSCVQKNSVWKNFLRREYNEDFDTKDLRIEAALAHLFPDGSASLIRQRLSENADPSALPFWSIKVRESEQRQSLLDFSIQRSADILLNSLGMLAFTTTPSIYSFWRQRFDFDALADWLVSQQDGRHQFENALDTYFGLKALHAYRSMQLTTSANNHIYVNVSAANQTLRYFDDNEVPLKLGLPVNATSIEVRSMGEMRMVMGVRVMTEKRRRSKRDPSENYPVSIKITQKREGSSAFFTQKVTIMSHSSLLTRLEIEHGLMTGFYSRPEWIQLTTRGVGFLIEPRVRPNAVNFVISGLQRDKEVGYEMRIGEPTGAYSLDYLAPFLITARHHVVVGRLVVFPKDLDFSQSEEFSRRKRFTPMVQHLTQSANLIETVCVENGACTCAEATCDVLCQSCGYVKVEDLCREYQRPFGFVVVFKLLTHREVNLDGNTFDVFDVHPYEWFGLNEEIRGEFSIWMRSCNTICKRAARDAKGRFLLIGRSDGIFYSPINHSNGTDTSLLHRHYLLRNEDRLAKASDCWALFSEFQDHDCINRVNSD